LVARLKYRNARSSLPFLADRLAALVAQTPVDVVTWAPTTALRRRQRGFDQAELLARALARRLHVPCRQLLLRPPGKPQTGQPLDARRTGPTFHPAHPARSSPSRVLLVDDVVTSGATVAAAARTLKANGADQVHVVAAARTAPGRRGPWPGLHSQRVAVCGSVVESRGQSQAKRPT
jgi:predicted amidophosphoribosyltransferase